jgi:ferredoxin/Flp pilus assembly protein TadD
LLARRAGRRIAAVSAECGPQSTASASAPARPNYARRRAWVLGAVHAAILAHVLHWLWSGSTLSPLEPSEATDLAEHGRINAGAVFFALAIGVTALFGRWFCGWACHLVALQDGARWLLLRAGVRPRAIQLGVLGLVPLVACVYMFLGPWLYRLWQGQSVPTHLALYTEEFWVTFPGATMAVVTFLVTGAGMVYFLGSKGFCTYACPYGAIFGVVDQLAPQRIRVTDACQQCGKCTVACSSNVRVHQEVRDFGAVIDPGCMKCLDCVSACPNDALYVGFGAPALWTARRAPAPAKSSRSDSDAARWLLSAAFVFGLFTVLFSHKQLFSFSEHGGFAVAIAAGSLAVAWIFRGKSTRSGGPALAEEGLVGGSYLVALHVLRGYRPLAGFDAWLAERAPWTSALELGEGIPLLLALGLAGLVAYGVLLLVRLALRSEVALQAHVLRASGRVTRSGYVFAASMVAVLAVTAHAGYSRGAQRAAAEQASLERARTQTALASALERGQAALAQGDLSSARTAFEEALELDPNSPAAQRGIAAVYFGLGLAAECEAAVAALLAAVPGDLDGLFLRGLLAIQRGDEAAAERDWRAVVELDPGHPAAREALATLCEQRGDAAGAAQERSRARRDG